MTAADRESRRVQLLTVGEYAALVRCSEKTVYRRIWTGQQCGAVRIGGQWRIDLAACPKLSKDVQN